MIDEEVQQALDQALTAWYDEQARRWRVFLESLTPEQQELLRQYRRATATIAKLRRWREAARRGKRIRVRMPPPGA